MARRAARIDAHIRERQEAREIRIQPASREPTCSEIAFYGWRLWQPHNANWKLHARGMKPVVFSNRGWGALVEIDRYGLEAEFLPRQSSVCRAKFRSLQMGLGA